MKYKLVIFDLDGTLLDTIDDLGTAANHALSVKGLPLHSPAEFKYMVGNGVRNLVKRALPEDLREDEGMLESTLADFMEYYSSHIAVHTRPYKGIPELLAGLSSSGVKMAVASNKFEEGTRALISHSFPDIPFVDILGNAPGRPLKPDSRIVSVLMEKAGVSAEETVMIGDSETDLRTASNAGIDCIAVSWGFRSRQSLIDSGATLIADTVGELKGMI